MANKERWITVNGQHILIKDGQSVNDALKERFGDKRGKKRINNGKHEYSFNDKDWEDMDDESYKDFDADDEEFDENTEDDYKLDEEKDGKKPSFAEEWNKKMSRSAEMGQLVQNARKNGQTPQQVLDSVSYDMDIEPGSEEFKTLKSYVMHDTRLNKDTGEYEYNKYNIGSNKLLNNPDDRAKMEKLSNALKEAGLDNELTDGWEDYGAGMQWTAPTSDNTWILNPKQWIDYMNDNKSAEEIIDELKNDNYFKGKFKSPQNAAAGGGTPPDDPNEFEKLMNNPDLNSEDLQIRAAALGKLYDYLKKHPIKPQTNSPLDEFNKKTNSVGMKVQESVYNEPVRAPQIKHGRNNSVQHGDYTIIDTDQGYLIKDEDNEWLWSYGQGFDTLKEAEDYIDKNLNTLKSETEERRRQRKK